MKKLLMMLAIVLVGMTQAASINWTISNVYGPDGTTKAAIGTYSAYLFVTANSTDVSTGINVVNKTDILALLSAGDLTGAGANASLVAVNNSEGIFGGATGLGGANARAFSSGSLSAFAVVFDNTSAETANNYLIVNNGDEKSVAFTSATGAKALGFGSQTALTQGPDNKWVSTTPIPEPTSGLLLLVGGALLALRRKQK